MPLETRKINGLYVDHVAGEGAKILFIHGSSGGSWYWEHFMHRFAEAGYDCYAVNLRGHHPNPELPELGKVTMAEYVDDVRGVLSELGGDVVLVGHSMGGAIAQMLAAEKPLKAAIFASSAPVSGVKFQNPPFNIWFLLHILRSLPAMARKKALKPGFKVNRAAVLNKVEPERQRELSDRMVPESATVGIEVLKGTIEADLSGVGFPMLTCGGTEDHTTVLAMEKDIAALQKTDFIEFPGHGHMFMLEPGWEECADRVIEWLRSKSV